MSAATHIPSYDQQKPDIQSYTFPVIPYGPLVLNLWTSANARDVLNSFSSLKLTALLMDHMHSMSLPAGERYIITSVNG